AIPQTRRYGDRIGPDPVHRVQSATQLRRYARPTDRRRSVGGRIVVLPRRSPRMARFRRPAADWPNSWATRPRLRSETTARIGYRDAAVRAGPDPTGRPGSGAGHVPRGSSRPRIRP